MNRAALGGRVFEFEVWMVGRSLLKFLILISFDSYCRDLETFGIISEYFSLIILLVRFFGTYTFLSYLRATTPYTIRYRRDIEIETERIWEEINIIDLVAR